MKPPTPLKVRFWDKVDVRGPDDCWPWLAYTNPRGYGRVRGDHGKVMAAHRAAYELLVGPIPEGLQLDHLCRNRGCVNPAHLEPVTNAENSRRGFSPPAQNGRKTHCINGHPFAGENLWLGKNGVRRCRTCTLARMREARIIRKAAA